MLIRDFHCANAVAINMMVKELMNKERDVAIFLLDFHPSVSSHITSDVVVGIGWDDKTPTGTEPAVRWLGVSLSPSEFGTSRVCDDPELVPLLLANQLARAGLLLEKQTGHNIWAFAQPHIKTLADANKLCRYMNRYPALH